MPGPQAFTVERRDHPFGEEGVRRSLEEVANYILKGYTHPKVVAWAQECLERARKEQGISCKTERQRAEVLLRAVQKKLWIPDPVGTEWMAGAHLMACDRTTKDELCLAPQDCFPEGTLLFAEGHELVPVEKLKEGTKIWGFDRWSVVEKVWYKGILPVDAIRLSNGSDVKLTGDHHVFVLDCSEHPMFDDEGNILPEDRHWRGGSDKEGIRWGCSCPLETRIEKRIRVSDLREGMVLISPDRLPFGTETLDPDVAWVEGVFVADGWVNKSPWNHEFSISGQDGCPKEEQKRRVESICARLSIPTRWQRKSIAVKNHEWMLRMQQMGSPAINKHLLSINLDEAAAAETLRGVMADSGKNSKGTERTFTTTSRELMLQTRILHKMFGISCGYRFVENHGGLGKNPVYRLGTRRRVEEGESRRGIRSLLRVHSIEREVFEAPCWDITTDDHRVYLAEYDVTVSNCDDRAIICGSSMMAVGLYCCVVGHGYNTKQDIEHVILTVRLDGQWVYADPSEPSLPLGKCVKPSRERVISLPNNKVICDARACFTNPSDYDPIKSGFVEKGVFVGVNGIPAGIPDFVEATPEALWKIGVGTGVEWF